MSSVAVNANHRTPSGTGAEASRRNSGEPSRSARTIAPNGSRFAHGEPPKGDPEGDDRVDLPGEATARDGLRDDDPAQAVSNQIYLVRAGLRQEPLYLDGEPVGQLLHRGSERRVSDRLDGQASGSQGSREQGPARLRAPEAMHEQHWARRGCGMGLDRRQCTACGVEAAADQAQRRPRGYRSNQPYLVCLHHRGTPDPPDQPVGAPDSAER